MLPDAGCEQGPFIGRVLPFSDDNLRVHFRSVTLERQGLPPTSYLAGGIGRRKPRIFLRRLGNTLRGHRRSTPMWSVDVFR